MELLFMCLKIFFARIMDVSLGAIRTVNTIKGRSFTAAAIAFVEVTIWFLVAKEALNTSSTNPFIVISYAAGFSCGTLLGTIISKNFVKGLVKVEVITKKATEENIQKIKSNGYGVSIIELKNAEQEMLLIEAKNSDVKNITKLINEIDPDAFVVINESKMVHNGFIK